MSKLRVNCIGMSLDGFAAGPGQDLENPMGRRGMELHEWVLNTRTMKSMFGDAFGASEGETGIDDDFAAHGKENIGAWILGRNMFGPIRGPWPDNDWKGWWGEEPPYHCDVFVLTHYPRDPIEMKGGTVFHFVTNGIHSALERARKAANGKDVRVGGGAATIRQYLAEGLVDEMHLAVGPVLLGKGEALFAGIDPAKAGFNRISISCSSKAAHFVLSK